MIPGEEFENQDVGSEDSSVPQTGQESDQQGESQAGSEQQPDASATQPFHEHPRFRELVEQKNSALEQLKSFQSQFAEMQAQMRAMQQASAAKRAEEDALHARLKGIDPEFGERFAKLDMSAQELQELKQWKAQVEADRVREKAISTISQLHEQNKVPAELRELYNTQIQAAAMANPKLGLQDLPQLYSQIHGKLSKLFEARDRQQRESYLGEKKKDAQIPASQPKGKAPSGKKSEFSSDPFEARQQLVARVREQLRSERDS